MKLIPLTQGKFTQVDDEDYDRANQHKWHARRASKHSNKFYAVREYRRANGARAIQFLHAFLTDRPPHMETHHIDNDGLNNQRKSNLVVVTRAEHKKLDRDYRRRRRNTNSTTLFKGVTFYAPGRYCARISENKQRILLGHFSTAADAARARDAKARTLGWPESGMNYPHDLRLAPVALPAVHRSHISADNTSGYRGTSFSKRDQKWRSYIVQDRRQYFLGTFDSAEEAARARDTKARELGWPESVMNFPL